MSASYKVVASDIGNNLGCALNVLLESWGVEFPL
jgi:hypothetical protein